MANENPQTGRFILVIAGLAVVLGLGILVLYALDAQKTTPWALLVLAAAIALALPVLRANFFPSARDCAAEYDFHEKRLAAQHRQWITGAFGAPAFDALFSGPDQFRENAGTTLEKMHQDPRAQGQKEVHLALLMTLARLRETRGEPERSMETLSQALALAPNHFIANFRMAMLCEWVEDPIRAVRYYRRAAEDPQGLSRAMKKLVTAQVARLAKESSQHR